MTTPRTAAGLHLYHGIAIRGQEYKAARDILAIEAEARAAYTDPQDRWRLVRVHPDVLAQWGTRTEDGDRLTVEWGEPDDDGIYDPTFTRHSDDNLRAEARAAALDGLPDALAVVFAYNESNASVAPNGSVEFGGEPTSYWRDRAEAVIDALRERRGE